MNSTVTLQDLAIVLVAHHHRPTILNLDFLYSSGIIPRQWELASAPLLNEQAAQLVFQNGITLAAQGNRFMLAEPIANKPDTDIQVAAIAHNYMQLLPQADYQAVGINVNGYVGCPDKGDAAQDYMMQTLLNPGPWQTFGEAPAHAAITFNYTLEQGLFILSVNEATLQKSAEDKLPVILFAGNFSDQLTAEAESDRFQQASQMIQNWQGYLDTYRDLINTHFLAGVTGNSQVSAEVLALS
jgi:hypothetical protein